MHKIIWYPFSSQRCPSNEDPVVFHLFQTYSYTLIYLVIMLLNTVLV